MKPHEIAACVKKMFTEHPEKFHKHEFFGGDGSCCTLGAAILCVAPDWSQDNDETQEEMGFSRLLRPVYDFQNTFKNVVGDHVDLVNDREWLQAILVGLEKVIEDGLKNETH